MINGAVEVKLDTRELDRLAATLDRDIIEIIEAVAFEVERDAKLLAPVDTGALRASIYTRTRKSGGLSTSLLKGLSRAYRKNKSMGSREITELPAPTGNEVAIVGPSVDYAFWVEFGHDIITKDGKKHIAGKPFLGPATEKWRHKVNNGDMFRELFK